VSVGETQLGRRSNKSLDLDLDALGEHGPSCGPFIFLERLGCWKQGSREAGNLAGDSQMRARIRPWSVTSSLQYAALVSSNGTSDQDPHVAGALQSSTDRKASRWAVASCNL